VEGELVHVLAEIGLGRGLDPEGLPAERDLVQIELEDLLLVQHAFDAPREDHFLELAGDRIFVADQDVLGDLLGNRGTAASASAGPELGRIVDHGPGQPGVINPAVAPEALVLGREEGVDDGLGEIDEAQLHTPFAGVGVDDLAIHAADHGGQRRLVRQQTVGRWQVARDRDPDQQVDRNNRPEQAGGNTELAIATPHVPEPDAKARQTAAETAGLPADAKAQARARVRTAVRAGWR